MKIAKYIGDLLYDYECVVIPGLGGFLTDDKPVLINEVTYSFSPPFRKIHFNIYLRTNDGLLVNHIAQQEQIGYKTAKQRVDQFVFQCHNALDKGRKIKFQNIGSLSHDSDKNIVFTQDIKVNYSPNSFGLSGLISPAIRRVTDEEKVKKVVKAALEKKKARNKPVDRKVKIDEKVKQVSNIKMHGKHRKSSLTNQLIVLLAIVLVTSAGIMHMNRDTLEIYIEEYSSNIPFFYSSVNDYLSQNINSSHVAELSRSTASFFPFFLDREEAKVQSDNSDPVNEITTEVIEKDDDGSINIETDLQPEITNNTVTEEKVEIPIAVKEVENPKIVEESPVETNLSSDRFFIIAGSFSDESNAKRLIGQLNNKGYSALIADTNKYGMYRVAIMKFSDRILAENNLLAIRADENPKAWLLVK